MAATPMPLSPPRVVPSPRIQSPSRTSLTGSVRKSCSVLLSFSHTMSRWAWRITAGPGALPGLYTTTLPAPSATQRSPVRAAAPSTYSLILSSCFDSLGIAEISRKNLHTASGCSPSVASMVIGSSVSVRGFP